MAAYIQTSLLQYATQAETKIVQVERTVHSALEQASHHTDVAAISLLSMFVHTVIRSSPRLSNKAATRKVSKNNSKNI
jgi:hypothetical protein